MSSTKEVDVSCALCQQQVKKSEKWTCNTCEKSYHKACVRKNDNITSWSCPNCKQLRVPPPPKSRQSSRKTEKSDKSRSVEVELELIEEEQKLLAKHKHQKELLFAEAEKAMRIHQEKEIELLRKKVEILKTASDNGSLRSGKSLSGEKQQLTNDINVKYWKVPAININAKQTGAIPKNANAQNPLQSFGLPPPPNSTLLDNELNNTANDYKLSNESLAARQVIDLKLTKFDGNPLLWQRFYSRFTSTTAQCNITAAENIERLNNALVGKAYEAVKFKLLHPDNLDSILTTLKRLFGRDELVLNAQLNEMRLIKPRMEPLDSIVQYAISVQNISESMGNSSSKNHLYNPLLLQEMVEKLPPPIKLEWADYRCDFSEVTIEVFSSWLFEKAMRITEVMGTTPKFESKNKNHNFINFHEHQQKKDCVICGKGCRNVENCQEFMELNVSEKWEVVRRNNLCRSCLKGHNGRCRANIRCKTNNCTARHNSLLHQENINDRAQSQVNPEMLNAHNHIANRTLFKYVPITLFGKNRTVSTYAFLDDGSSVTVMEQSLADELELDGKSEPLCLKWTSNESRVESNSKRISVDVRGKHCSQKYNLKARTVDRLDLPEQTLTKRVSRSLQNVVQNLAVDWYSNVKPRVLIGLDNAKMTITQDVRIDADRENIFVGRTKLGWVVYGDNSLNNSNNHGLFHICDCSANAKLLEVVESFVVQDNLTVTPTILKSKDDERAIQIMEKTTRYVDGRYETGLLWRYDSIQIPFTFTMAKRRLLCLERRLSKDLVMAQKLKDEITNYISKGYAVKLSSNEIKDFNSSWYLPIFLVRNPNKPDKIRLVWDAAAKINNISLNSLLLKGPDLLSSLPGILCRFRQRKIGITGDISEMFHQIRIRQEDRSYQRFLYRDDPNKDPDVYEMVVMIFGACCSPTSAQYIKNFNASKFQTKYPRASYSIINNHYMDDMLDSVDTEEEAVQLASEVREIHAFGGFNIRGWISNAQNVTEQLTGKEQKTLKNLDMSENAEKVLGMWWNTNEDTFTFSLKFNKGNKDLLKGHLIPTKREVLRIVMSIYDPLGLLSHFMIYAKILLQEIWRAKIDWDTKLTHELHAKWNDWLSMLHQIENLQIPRCYHENICEAPTELHIFVDAGECAYAAVAFARVLEPNRTARCALITAKSKVCPLKGLTVPRMELNAAVLGCRLSTFVIQSLEFEFQSCTYWSDSKTVLSWLKSDNRNYHQYVSSRVAEILRSSNVSQWIWVPTDHNVADMATKMKLADLSNDNCWFGGPLFLRRPKCDWPETIDIHAQTNEELKANAIFQVNFQKEVYAPEHHSTWRPLLRSRAYMCRFYHNLKARSAGTVTRSGQILCKEDYDEAEKILIKKSQLESYPDEICELLNQNNVSKSSSIYRLLPYLSDKGILMSKGRVFDTIILSRHHPITKLIIKDYHRRYHHHFHETVINELMQRFKIPKLRSAANSVVRECQKCKNEKARPLVPRMANIPNCRLEPFTRPFSFVGLDYFGPITVTVGRRVEKRYGVLITCLTIRAVHIEVAHTLNTDSCILAIRNFMNRRGNPLEVYSDNAKNFAGCKKELREIYFKSVNKEAVAESFVNATTKWFFIPPASPHMGGVWERQVRSVKNTLQKIQISRNPSDELLRSMLIEVEHIINSRPLTYIPLENESSEVLTPNHFLLGSSSGVRTYGEFSDKKLLLLKNWKISQQFAASFQKRWVRDYLPTLNRTQKWYEEVRNLKVGDIVLIYQDKIFGKCRYPKGIITEIYESSDGRVRKATVKTSDGIYVRPAVKLARLEVNPASEGDQNLDTSLNAEDASGGSVGDSLTSRYHLAKAI